MTLIQSSGYLEKIGYEVPKGSPDQVFRLPDAIHKALIEAGAIPG
jgi:hypothetical protein